jgi:hypothetical protein
MTNEPAVDDHQDETGLTPDQPSAHRKTRIVDRSAAFTEVSTSGMRALSSHESLATAKPQNLSVSIATREMMNISPAMQKIAEASRMPNLIRSVLGPMQHASELSQVFDRIRPAHEIMRQRAISNTHENVISEAMRLMKASSLLAVHSTVQNSIGSIGSVIARLDPIGSHLREILSSSSAYFERLRTLPQRLKVNLASLAEAGWYLDAEMPISDVLEFSEELLTNTAEEIDGELAAYFRDALDRIERDLVDRHPHRARLISEAFTAHRHGDLYGLAIQGFLSQADGVCFDRTNKQLFTKSGPQSLAGKVDPDTLDRIYLDLLGSSMPLTAGATRRKDSGAKLNRHTVMHGESTDYGTEVNSLKAISFLNFVSHAFDTVIDWNEIQDERCLGPAAT